MANHPSIQHTTLQKMACVSFSSCKGTKKRDKKIAFILKAGHWNADDATLSCTQLSDFLEKKKKRVRYKVELMTRFCTTATQDAFLNCPLRQPF